MSGSIAQGEALRSSLAAPSSSHLPTLLKCGEGFEPAASSGGQPPLHLSQSLSYGSILLAMGPKLQGLGQVTDRECLRTSLGEA